MDTKSVTIVVKPSLLRTEISKPLGEIKHRIRVANWTRWLRESNCLGTALFIAGELPKEQYVNPDTAHETYLSKLARLNEPVEGCIVAWQGQFVWDPVWGRGICYHLYTAHVGIVTAVQPEPYVAHRKGLRGKFIANQSLKDMINKQLSGYDTVYYLPSILANQTF
jgi:hypothetical protein